MRAAADLRRQVESALAGRIPAALSFRPPVASELLPCGVAEVDAALGGGLPLGAITELTGAASSGRTTLALSTLAGVTRQGAACVYVDVSDSLDPLSAAALGVDLRRLLWVRAGEADAAVAGSPFPATAPAPALMREKFGPGFGGCHPRHEAVGMHRAIGDLFRPAQQDCVDFTPRCSEAVRRERVRPLVFAPMAATREPPVQHPRKMRRETAWTRLDQALRATDLLLATGGFRALVLDLGDVPPEQARRVPLATWYRFRLQVEKSRTLFLLITRVGCANSCATVSLHCRQAAVNWQQAAENSPALLAGLRYCVSVARSRAVASTCKKPVASAQAAWSSTVPWTR